MNVIVVGHSVVRNFKNPEGEDFERYVLKIHEKAAGTVREWVDALYFARKETHAVKDQRTKRFKGISTDDCILQTRWSRTVHCRSAYVWLGSAPRSAPSSSHRAQQASQPSRPAHFQPPRG